LLFCFEFGYIFISLLEFENAGLVVWDSREGFGRNNTKKYKRRYNVLLGTF
jgi:hypothetical protein